MYKPEKVLSKCGDCIHCTADEETGELICGANLDEDEMEKFSLRRTELCSRYNSKSKPGIKNIMDEPLGYDEFND